MLARQLGTVVLARIFGDGMGADLAARGTVYLADGVRQAIERPDERLTRVRLRPGESYTVIARPPATRTERRLADRQRALQDRRDRMDRPSRRQLRAARRLARTQRRLDRARPDGRRARRLQARERARGAHFDKVMRPTRRQAAVHAELSAVSERLDSARSASFDRARARRRRPLHPRARVRVFD